MKIRFYFAQTEAEQTRKEYIVRYNMHEGIVTTVRQEDAPTFDLAEPDRRHSANIFQTMMQVMNSTPNPVQFEIVEELEMIDARERREHFEQAFPGRDFDKFEKKSDSAT